MPWWLPAGPAVSCTAGWPGCRQWRRGAGELSIDASQSCLGGFQIQLGLGFDFVQFGELVCQAFHLVRGGVNFVGHLVGFQPVFRSCQFSLGGNHTLFQEFSGGLGFSMGEIGEPVQESFHQKGVGFLCFFRGFAGDIDFQNLGVLIGLGGNAALYIAFVVRIFPVFQLFGLLDDRNDYVAAFQNFRIGIHFLFNHLVTSGRQGAQNRAGKPLVLLDTEK